jgi:hypothetical protein
MSQDFPPTELRLIDLTIRMFTDPVLQLDEGMLNVHLHKERQRKKELLENFDKATLMSNPKFADLLTVHGVTPPMKKSPATGKETYAFAKTDEAFKALLGHENPSVQALVAARLGTRSTIEESRTERFIGIARRGAMPVPLRYYAAHTGRWGGDDKLNLQNLPRGSTLKKAILAPAGYMMIDSDSSQIEARTLAWLAGQDDLVEAFDRGEDVYKIMASAIYGRPVADITKDERFVGKTTILGCIGAGSMVLCGSGWKPIEQVTLEDKLWDGGEWVCHQGLVPKGEKETLSLSGLWLTPDHKVLCGTQWLEAQSVAQDKNILSQALATGAVSWLSPATSRGQEAVSHLSSFAATAGNQSTLLTGATSSCSEVLVALFADGAKGTANGIGLTPLPCRILGTESDFSTAYLPPSADATYLQIGRILTTAVGVYPFTSSGVTTGQSFSGMLELYRGGTTPSLTWTVPTTTEDTNPETFGLSQGQTTMPIDEKSVSSRRNLMTYDIAYAGPRNRYTVATNAGPIIVHNCGYGMGAKKFQAQLKTFGVDLSPPTCEFIINVYRETYPKIPELWQEGQDAIAALLSGTTSPLGKDGVVLVNAFGIRLPNGLYLKYPNLRAVSGDRGRREFVYDQKKGRAVIPNRLYGGKLIENVCQALARIIIGEQMLMISRRQKVVMTVHDAVGSIVPDADAAEGRAFVEECMRIKPKWAEGLPLNCESKMGKSYGG